MSKNLANYRKDYSKMELLEEYVSKDPFVQFRSWFEEMEALKTPSEINAMNVSSIGSDGFPKNRIVLLKEFNEEGFIFYTNFGSDKAKALMENPNTCLSFFWPELERQVIIKGIAEKASEAMAIAYFNSRPRESQLGAWASHQSAEIASRAVLDKTLRELTLEFHDKPIPKPDFWGGFLVKPVDFEFWQGRPNRLHDRILYTKEGKNWSFKRLAP
ncbi:pyridoxamine 5'-phosphate oxidase [Gillisia sp. Hel_I_86]|uniref:pyridoxamine 5'-phosphate oxidase n=1 Tax=Gillisia sp. Hel_I_86 TaxID=1249981 RepID=UPI00119A9ADD|nr:pyridoxamine 5'-phosphate oxidase [Gillisia sp. Hel_I_86]TVZ27747.1 pyridoxamine 5'-phosphate oxidase [Gillisia sp. Hel_I_86]